MSQIESDLIFDTIVEQTKAKVRPQKDYGIIFNKGFPKGGGGVYHFGKIPK